MNVHHSDLLWVPNWLAALLNPVLGSWWSQTFHRLLLVNDWTCLGANTGHSYRTGTTLMVSLFLGVSISMVKTFLDLQWNLSSSYSIFLPHFILDPTSCFEDSPCLLLLLHHLPPNSSASNPILAYASWMMWISIPSKKRKTLKQLDRLPILEL